MTTATTAGSPDLSNRFVALRFERGLTQTDIADATGISRGTLSNLEKGGEPSAPTARKLAQFYGLRVQQIMGAEPIARETPDVAA
jgi:transcriptional regulator with XRE-family HTH domain